MSFSFFKPIIVGILSVCLSVFVTGSAFSQVDSLSADKVRTQSGVDPTRVVSRLVYSVWYYNRSENRSQINNRLNFTLGVNRWSFSLKPELVTNNTSSIDGNFTTKGGDMRFSLLNAFYVKDKHALAAGAEFTIPTAPVGFGGQYFSINPSLTYSYTINKSLLFAIQPQYLFDLEKIDAAPDLSVLTLRIFIAKFLNSGWFFVFEPRITNDLNTDDINITIAPIIGKSLGGGFNLTSVIEIPTEQENIDNRGVLIQLGITKNF